jgi:hypothetical protein
MPITGAASPAGPASLLILLLSADGLFVALHVLHLVTPFFQDARFSIELERGFGETYQYVKAYWAALLLLLLGLGHRSALYLAWSLVLAFLLVDDAFMVHETLGARLGPALVLPGTVPLQGHHAAEALVLAAVALLAVALVGLASLRADPGARRVSRRLLGRMAVLAGFGVGVDLVHAMIPHGAWHAVAGIVEDGGEMVVLSAIVALVAGPPRAAGLAWGATRERAA